jgi:hypothetical protein
MTMTDEDVAGTVIALEGAGCSTGDVALVGASGERVWLGS